MAEKEPYHLELPFTSTKYGLQATWGFGNQLFVFPGIKGTLASDQSPSSGEIACIHEVQWETDMHSAITRRLVNESHNIFTTLQNQVKESNGSGLKPILVKASKQYRSVLKACSLELYNLPEDGLSEEKKEEYSEQMKQFNMTDLIWSLGEILWIDSPPGGMVMNQLLGWLRWHFSEGERLFANIRQDESVDQHPEYWDCVYRLVLQGQVDKVRVLLSLNAAFSSEAFQSMDEVLRKMPVFNHLSHANTMSEYEMKWRHWRDDCERRLESAEFATSPNLEIVAKILCGEDDIFSQLRDLCETWYHMLVSKMLYQKPTVKSVDLHRYVQGCMDEYRSDGRMTDLDGVLLSALEFDIYQLIKDCSSLFNGWWFVSHFTDILHHSGQLESHKLEYGSNVREHLLLEYVTSLMSHRSLWQVGVDYLDQCPAYGRQYLEQFIEHMPIESEHKAKKLLHICEKRNMGEQVKSICKVMGMRCLRNKRLGAALSWFLRSKDVAYATLMAERFLTEYNEHGQFTNLDLLDNLGPNMLLSSKLTFLGKYREYHKLYEQRELHAAGSLLLSLLTSRLASREFWITLLKDTLALLEAKECVYGTKETYELMHCLQELVSDSKYLNCPGDTNDLTDMKNTVELLRLGLMRNLARAVVMEGVIKPS